MSRGAGRGNVTIDNNVPVTGPLTNAELRTSPVPVYSDVSFQSAYTGLINGKTSMPTFVLGRRSTFASAVAFQDVCNYLVGGQSLYVEPSAATPYYLYSTSANDAVGGAGATSVRVVYLNASGVQTTVTKTLTGQTGVSLGTGFLYFQWMEVAAVTGGVEAAAGDIVISSSATYAGILEANTFEIIKAGGNRSLSARYRVPTGHSCYLLGMYGAAINQDMDLRLRATVFADDRSLSTVYHFQGTMYLSTGTQLFRTLPYLKCPAGSDVKMSVIPKATTGSPRCDANFHFLCVAD